MNLQISIIELLKYKGDFYVFLLFYHQFFQNLLMDLHIVEHLGLKRCLKTIVKN